MNNCSRDTSAASATPFCPPEGNACLERIEQTRVGRSDGRLELEVGEAESDRVAGAGRVDRPGAARAPRVVRRVVGRDERAANARELAAALSRQRRVAIRDVSTEIIVAVLVAFI